MSILVGKTIVFGLLKRQGNVYTEMLPNCSKATLQGIIRGHGESATVIHSDGWHGYDGLVDMGFYKHFRVNHGENELVMVSGTLTGLSLSEAMQNAGWLNLMTLTFLEKRIELPFELKLDFLFLRSAFVFDMDDRLLGHGDALARHLRNGWSRSRASASQRNLTMKSFLG